MARERNDKEVEAREANSRLKRNVLHSHWLPILSKTKAMDGRYGRASKSLSDFVAVYCIVCHCVRISTIAFILHLGVRKLM